MANSENRKPTKIHNFGPRVLNAIFTFDVRLFKSGVELCLRLLWKHKTTLGALMQPPRFPCKQQKTRAIEIIWFVLYDIILISESLMVKFNSCPPNYHNGKVAKTITIRETYEIIKIDPKGLDFVLCIKHHRKLIAYCTRIALLVELPPSTDSYLLTLSAARALECLIFLWGLSLNWVWEQKNWIEL